APDGVAGGLSALGYQAYGNSPLDAETQWFWRTEDPRCIFVAHLCRQGRPWLQRARDFRDFLCAHPEERDRYAALKQQLAAAATGDPFRYSLGKIELFHEIFTRAAAWREAMTRDSPPRIG
ncbi:MAG TPA: GrpB family protein, partial [Thermoanaerobaculia bacterium]|nr:GrpB family protein [Thermoanaerobaculia bacterium]